MKNNLIDNDLPRLQNARGDICVSIIVPTHRTSPERRMDKLAVEIAVNKAKQLLLHKCPEQKIRSIFQAIDDLFKEIDFVRNTEGIGLFISPNTKLLTHFSFPVKEKIIVGDNFEIRDLLYKINYAETYYILMLTESRARLFEGSWNDLVEIKGNNWPFRYEEEYTYSKPVHSSSSAGYSHIKAFEKDKSELEAIRLKSFYREVDKGLDPFLDHNSPLFILAPGKEPPLFEKVSRHTKNIIHKIHGSYDHMNLKSISDLVWPLMFQHLQNKSKELINEFKETIGQRRGISGIQPVWEAAKEGKAFKLLVEKDYCCPGFVTENNYKLYLRPPHMAHKTLPDAVDELIETVLQKNGKVYFTDNDLLTDYDRIALITRY